MTAVLLVLLAVPLQDAAASEIARFLDPLDRQDQEPLDGRPIDRFPVPRPSRQESPWERLGRFLGHPFRDNGRRFDAYPYAGDGPYFLTSRLSTKTSAGMIESTFGRIEHDLLSFGTEAMISWSAGCDVRIDSLIFEEEVGRGTEETHVHHVHLDIGGYEGPNTVDYSLGFGVGALDDEESSEFGPSVRAAVRWFPGPPFSLRLDAVYTWFGDDAVADLRGEIGFHVHRFATTVGVRSIIRSDGDDFIGPTLGTAIFF